MALTHDVCESLAGDVTPFCDAKLLTNKHACEDGAMRRIQKIVGAPLGVELYELWQEYEGQETIEALYCKDIDKFEMVMQAYEYERAHLTHKMGSASEMENDSRTLLQPLRTFYITTNTSMKSPLFKRLDGELRDKREVLLSERGWDVTNVERQAY